MPWRNDKPQGRPDFSNNDATNLVNGLPNGGDFIGAQHREGYGTRRVYFRVVDGNFSYVIGCNVHIDVDPPQPGSSYVIGWENWDTQTPQPLADWIMQRQITPNDGIEIENLFQDNNRYPQQQEQSQQQKELGEPEEAQQQEKQEN